MKYLKIILIILVLTSYAVVADLANTDYASNDIVSIHPVCKEVCLNRDQVFTGDINFTGNVEISNLTIRNVSSYAINGSLNITNDVSASQYCFNNNGCISGFSDVCGYCNEVDPLSIHKDGSSTTTQNIGFAEGITIYDNETITFGQVRRNWIWKDEVNGIFYIGGVDGDTFHPSQILIEGDVGNTIAVLRGNVKIKGGDMSGVTVPAGKVTIAGGNGIGVAGNSGNVEIYGGIPTSSGLEGIVIIGNENNINTSHALNNYFDLLVGGGLEVNGIIFADGNIVGNNTNITNISHIKGNISTDNISSSGRICDTVGCIPNVTSMFKTGDLKYSFNITQPGWVPCLGGTIGKTGSGADYSGEEYHALYEMFNSMFGGGDWDGLVALTLPDSSERFIISTDPNSFALTTTGGSMTSALTSTTQLPSLGGEPEKVYLTSPLTVSKISRSLLGSGTSIVIDVTTGSVNGNGATFDVTNAYIRAILLIKT